MGGDLRQTPHALRHTFATLAGERSTLPTILVECLFCYVVLYRLSQVPVMERAQGADRYMNAYCEWAEFVCLYCTLQVSHGMMITHILSVGVPDGGSSVTYAARRATYIAIMSSQFRATATAMLESATDSVCVAERLLRNDKGDAVSLMFHVLRAQTLMFEMTLLFHQKQRATSHDAAVVAPEDGGEEILLRRQAGLLRQLSQLPPFSTYMTPGAVAAPSSPVNELPLVDADVLEILYGLE